jgi:aminoglycoside N3'-acetyltransferase
VHPPPDEQPPRNGCDYGLMHTWPNNAGRVFAVDFNGVIADMGIIPRTVVERPGRARGYHPGSSFAAVGPLARKLTDPQQPLDVYAPLEGLARHGGSVILMGVGLNRLTLLHQAEKRAGRNLARRWANGLDGGLLTVEAGGCSTGFPKLDGTLAPLERRTKVGESVWRVFPAEDTLRVAAEAIVADPSITHCGQDCIRCDDAVAGGPIL